MTCGCGTRRPARRCSSFTADDQRLVTFGDDSYLRVWDALKGKLKGEYRLKPDNPFAGRFGDDDDEESMMRTGFEWRVIDLGADGRTLALASGKDVRGLSTETGQERFKIPDADPGGVQQLALSADGKRMVTGGPGVAQVPPKVGQAPE